MQGGLIDRDTSRAYPSEAFAGCGTATVATNGSSALEKLRRNPENYDLVLSDVYMPGATCRRLYFAVDETPASGSSSRSPQHDSMLIDLTMFQCIRPAVTRRNGLWPRLHIDP